MTDESTDSEAAEDESSAEDHPDLMRRIEMIEGIMEAPEHFVDRLYDHYGKSMVGSAGRAAGVAAGFAVGGPVGGIMGGVVGSKVAGNLTSNDGPLFSENAPAAVGAYPHAHRVGNLLFISGIGPRQAGTDEIPGGPIKDADGIPLDYDVRAQTRAVIENIKIILEDLGSSLEDVVDCLTFLIDMDRDFAGYNEVYAEYFGEILCSRTTVAVSALPTAIAVEMKVVAKL